MRAAGFFNAKSVKKVARESAVKLTSAAEKSLQSNLNENFIFETFCPFTTFSMSIIVFSSLYTGIIIETFIISKKPIYGQITY